MTIRRFLSPTVRLKNCWSIGVLILSLTAGCKQETNSDTGLEIISVDLSESRSGKLSEFFEPHIEYIWLEDKEDDAQLSFEVGKILFHEDRIYTLDLYGCNCIHIFDKSSRYLSKLKAYGEGPGEYLEFNDLTFHDGELVLLGVYPRKIMRFSPEGSFLREEYVQEMVRSGIYNERDGRFYLFAPTRDPGDTFVKNFDAAGKDTLEAFPYDPNRFYLDLSGRGYFQKSIDNLYFGMATWDTIYQVRAGNFIPKLVFDFGKYAQNLDEIMQLDERSEQLDFINKRSKLFFRGNYLISENHLYTILVHQRKGYTVFYDRKQKKPHIIEGRLIDDIHGGHNPYSIIYHFEQGKVGLKISGKTLYRELTEKKTSMGSKKFEHWAKNEGKALTAIALKAKDSENPVLIVYGLK
nr:6-bladed beta-propeller [Cytophagales bacterium]